MKLKVSMLLLAGIAVLRASTTYELPPDPRAVAPPATPKHLQPKAGPADPWGFWSLLPNWADSVAHEWKEKVASRKAMLPGELPGVAPEADAQDRPEAAVMVSIPEPGTVALVTGAGLLLVGLRRRRIRRCSLAPEFPEQFGGVRD